MMKFRGFPSKQRRFVIHSRMRGRGVKANRMNYQRGGGGSGKFVLIQHDDEISSISVEKKGRRVIHSRMRGRGGQGKSYEMLMTGERGRG